jgi:hypothetical protein
VRRLSRRDALASLTDTDRRLLTLLSEQRVLTQTQLERLLYDTPARTLRYRTERLTRLGLTGRSRPYRDKGSAPFHYWPTRASDAFVRGEPAPRGGERPEPNPQFLHHAERLSELYVLLAVQAPTVGLRLHTFKREADAREPFRAGGRERALAPDALIHLHDDSGRDLLAFVELDIGTMSHARLKTKAAGYAAYTAEAAWTESHPFCPCLLFLTTTESRAVAFLRQLNRLLDKQGRGSYYSRRRGLIAWFEAAACPRAREPERALAEACWDDLTLAGGGLTLTDCLNKARIPYDARRAKEEAEERARNAKRARLRARPEALRAYLIEKHVRLHAHLEQFGEAGAAALELLLASREDMGEIERDAFAAVVRQLDAEDPLEVQTRPEPVPPTVRDLDAVELLAETYRRRQRARIRELAHHYGVGPQLRRHRRKLDRGELLSTFSVDGLEADAKRDQEARRVQQRLRVAYLERRDREGRARKHQLGLATRLAHGHAAMHPVIDRERLRICRHCDETTYPDRLGRDRYGTPVYKAADRCHFCGSSDLASWNPARAQEVDYGPVGADLTFGGIAGSMDDLTDDDGEVFGL